MKVSLALIVILSSCDFWTYKKIIPEYKPKSDIWISAYFGAWNHYAPPGGNWGNLLTKDIHWNAFTHLIYFSLTANPDGSLSEIRKYHTFSPDRVKTIVSAAHKHDKPVLFSIGGWGNYYGFSRAISPGVRDKFVTNLIKVMEKWKFDGIDIDMEPIKDRDGKNYSAFITELHGRLQSKRTSLGYRPILTAATDWKPEIFAALHEKFDQINLMTYDLSGAWSGWISWHNSPVYSGETIFPKSKQPVPSANREINKFISAGVPKAKLGIGIDFYGYVWNGFVIKPGQSWIVRPVVQPNVPYNQIMEKYYNPEHYHWDEEAKAAYLSIDHILPVHKKFISFDDKRSIEAKIRYVREKGIGGAIIWELSGGYRKEQPEGEKDLLLQKVEKELRKKF